VELDELIITNASESIFVSSLLSIFYVVIMGILLINLLIAMMGDTYSRITEDAEKEWHLEWARIIYAIEDEMSYSERQQKTLEYATLIGGEKFLQVLEIDPDHYSNRNNDNQGLATVSTEQT
jgi:hypothetical protein